MPGIADNLLLHALSQGAREQITSRCTPVTLPLEFKFSSSGERSQYTYFITSGLGSVVVSVTEGSTSEVTMIGHEGAVGLLQVLGPAIPPTDAVVQIAGSGLRMTTADLRQIFQGSEEIRDLFLRRVQIDTMILAQVAACHRLHEAEERLARWLLMASDRVQSETLELTQEFLAEMLGARRATVTMIAGAMQRSGLVEYRRGHIRILNRQALEDAACECYSIVRDLNTSLTGN